MRHTRAFTLLELLVTIAVLGIAGAMVIPSMSEAGSLRVQGAVRTLVSDISFAQADAVAFQERRAIVFDQDTSSYSIVAVVDGVIDANNNVLFDPSKGDGRFTVQLNMERFGFARIESVNFGNGSRTLIFDDVGGPVATAGGDAAGPGGTVRITGSNQTFDLSVEAFTGRVTVARP